MDPTCGSKIDVVWFWAWTKFTRFTCTNRVYVFDKEFLNFLLYILYYIIPVRYLVLDSKIFYLYFIKVDNLVDSSKRTFQFKRQQTYEQFNAIYIQPAVWFLLVRYIYIAWIKYIWNFAAHFLLNGRCCSVYQK